MNSKANKKYTVMWPTIFIAPFVICFLIFNLYPILYSFYLSFTDWSGVGEKVFVGWGNYVRIFTKDKTFIKSLWNTLYIMILGFPVSIFLGLIIAAFLSNLKKFRNFFQTINFLPYITTPVAIGLVFTFLFDWNTGVINRIIEAFGGEGVNWLGNAKFAPLVIGFMIIWKCTGYYMALYLAGITSISEDIYEAAKVDGASTIKTFFKITVPLLRPITVFIVLTSVIYALQLFDEPNLMFNVSTTSIIGGPDRSCLTMVWNFYDVAFGSTARLGYGSAIATTLFIIIVIISLIGMKFMNGKEEN
ncbi:sugar ABC transporter permease [Sporanaerobium hydrogeniformans]|uniref:Sugar ABC transporter permease n=1 Tax=Sporanaerobium hydrogeniformans TaxID=3072179 RepID=A0AC61DGA8_9FIRM|nr:sugar ABC transporter permease [Sporanaerobium hydrogeniformans]PHV71885.1 sugar ABC transporter permease [Sporanaerobium hydrogeniformans]